MSDGPNNLYLSGLSKQHDDEFLLRRTFATFGKISSFKLISKPEFTTNIAYLAYVNPAHAKFALENAV